jgi:hypothetical protein
MTGPDPVPAVWLPLAGGYRCVAGRGDILGCGQERAGRGAVPVAGPAGREGGAVQGAEHGAQLRRHRRRRGDRPGPGDAGSRGRDRAGGGHEPRAAQAGQRHPQSGRAARPACRRRGRAGLPGPQAEAGEGGHRQPRGPAPPLRRGHLRGGGQPRRDQPAGPGPGQHGPGPRRGPAGGGRRGHRPGRAARRDVRYARGAGAGRPAADRRVHRQQVPRRPAAAGPRPGHAGVDDRAAHVRGTAMAAGSVAGGRGLPRPGHPAARDAAPGGGGHLADRGHPAPPDVQCHRRGPPGGRAGRRRRPGHHAWPDGRRGPGDPAWQPGHRQRPGLAA